jgi:ribonuclease-3
MKEVKKLEECLGYQFRDKNLIVEALTHKSYKKPYNNERLEFLGDAVLNLIVGEYLYNKFKDSNEGTLSKIRANLVNEKGFTRLANDIKLGEYIFLSPAEERNKGRVKASILSDAFEAIMGAIYLESGMDAVKPIMLNIMEKSYKDINFGDLFSDYKTALQELTQALYASTPEYKLVRAFGPDHKKEFEIEIYIDNKIYGKAIGKSKKEAQQKVAKIALAKLKKQG